MRVKDVMQPNVITVSPTTPVRDAYALMLAGGFRHLPVLDEQQRVVGIVSDRDLRTTGSTFKNPDSGEDEFLITREANVDTIMTLSPICVPPDTSISRATRIIREKRIGCLLVTENDGLVGILSYLDILDAAVDEHDEKPSTSRQLDDTQPLAKSELEALRRQLQDELSKYRLENPTPNPEPVVQNKPATFISASKLEREEYERKKAEEDSRLFDEISSQLQKDDK